MDSGKDDEEEDEKGGFGEVPSGSSGSGNRTLAGAMFLALFLIVGGLIAWFSMKNAARSLAGGDKYTQLSANSAGSSGGVEARTDKEQGFFASEEELAKADPSFKKELLDSAAAAATSGKAKDAGRAVSGDSGSYGTGGAGSEDFQGGTGVAVVKSGASGPGAAPKLLSRDIGLAQLKGGQSSRSGGLSSDERKPGAAIAAVRSDAGKPAGGLAKAAKMSVMDALKSAFKANVYGARLASNDAARVQFARPFDGNPESSYSLEYAEEMKKKLDRINPSSIPSPEYLRDQNLASDAKTLGVPEVGKPDFDKGTKEALAKAIFNPLGPFGGSGGGVRPDPTEGGNPAFTPSGLAGGGDPADGGSDAANYSDPNDARSLSDLAKEEAYCADSGEACGCTPAGPCCCLPPNAFAGQCPAYGPFQPGDPCAAEFNAAAESGDFPTDMWSVPDGV